MGASHSNSLKEAITSHNTEWLTSYLRNNDVNKTPEALNQSLNRKGDTALLLAIRHEHYDLIEPMISAGCNVHASNRLRETPLDLVVTRILSGVLRDTDHPSGRPPRSSAAEHPLLDHALRALLNAGARSPSLQKLALQYVEDSHKWHELCCMVPPPTLLEDPRLSCLLLQVSAWCHHQEVLDDLLKQGVETSHYWHTPFVPVIVPNTRFRGLPWPKTEKGEYFIPSLPEPETVLALKWDMLQEWRTHWDCNRKSSDQYRAGLQLPPSTALTFIKAANHPFILCRVMDEIFTYLPRLCGGPDLRTSPLITYLVLAGYICSPDEIERLLHKHGPWPNLTAICARAHELKSLKHLCRLRVRNCVRYNVLHSLQQLQCLPLPLREYISLDDVCTHDLVELDVSAAMAQ